MPDVDFLVDAPSAHWSDHVHILSRLRPFACWTNREIGPDYYTVRSGHIRTCPRIAWIVHCGYLQCHHEVMMPQSQCHLLFRVGNR